MHAARGLVHGIGVMLWFYAMSRLPIAEVTALGFTAPIFTAAGAMLFLGERSGLTGGRHRTGFCGCTDRAAPGSEDHRRWRPGDADGSTAVRLSLLLAKVATRTEPSSVIVALLSLFCTLTLLPWHWWSGGRRPLKN
ncbi:MAG: hypothetical protein Ct9H300mP16_02620 [Pseudomonadota bacterium]|nr:MAG: hypothetical protein Ct9H300mP16_02620 [Pseudomonadota bacterium]